jgi:hypothetical protein
MVHNVVGDGVKLEDSAVITGNRIDGCSTGITNRSGHDSVIDGNVILNCNTGINLSVKLGATNACENVIISNNVLKFVGTSGSLALYIASASGSLTGIKNVRFTNNIIENLVGAAIAIGSLAAGGEVHNLLIEGNTFTGSSTANTPSTAIDISGGPLTDIQIRNNRFNKDDQRYIRLRAGTAISVTGNICTGGSSLIGATAIRLGETTALVKSVVTQNILLNGSVFAIVDASSIVTNNIMTP